MPRGHVACMYLAGHPCRHSTPCGGPCKSRAQLSALPSACSAPPAPQEVRGAQREAARLAGELEAVRASVVELEAGRAADKAELAQAKALNSALQAQVGGACLLVPPRCPASLSMPCGTKAWGLACVSSSMVQKRSQKESRASGSAGGKPACLLRAAWPALPGRKRSRV